MTLTKETLKGIIAAVPTPFTVSDEVDEAASGNLLTSFSMAESTQ